MTPEEYQQLETLLNKLQQELGSKICVISNYHHDGIYIGCYDKNGNICKQSTAVTLEGAAWFIKEADKAVKK